MSAPVVSGNVVNSGSTAYVCSMAYPAMQGHVYAYDLSQCNTLNCTLSNPTCDSCTGTADNPKPAPRTPVLLWDAGQVLANSVIGADHTSGRSIWTWDPSTTALVEVTQQQQNLNKLQSINPSVTANVVDFIRGNDGTLAGTKRAWLLGPIINSTAAIVSAPQWWTGKNNIPSHAAFENLYAKNHPLLMVGSSDGMMHFFDVADGAEVLALLPPDQLAHQVTLYNNYKSGGATATGEPQDLSQHVFGVASSPRFADVYSATDSTYHTELLLTEGPGGRALSAIDITHPYPARTGVVVPYVDGKDATTQVPILKTKTEDFDADKNYDASAPVSVLWHKDGAFNYSSLGQTWSVPAVGITAFDATNPSFRAVLGSGYSATATPALLLLDAVTGAEKENYPLSSASGLVHNQSYGAGVLFNNTAVKNLPDDKLNLGLVCDTYGNVYGVTPAATPTASQLFSADAVNHYPLYYTPAVGYYDSWDIYAYATGNFYEKSTNVTGANTTFEPYVYIRLKDPLGVQSDRFVGFKISDFQYCSANCDSKTPTMSNVPKSAQITADPILFLPANSTPDSTKPVLAYFVFYDPNPALGCGGMSFLVKVSLDMSKLNGTGSNLSESLTTASSSLGTGAASGISFSGGQVIVAKSAVGQGSAGISSTGENGPDVIAGAPQITSWKELQ
jgi:Tfp pilus tip-associated adhesin PilY1